MGVPSAAGTGILLLLIVTISGLVRIHSHRAS